ncbi:MAG: NAD(P)H-dependent oxidoreductase subunit E, partial [Oscillospiraceae bacterium]
MAKTTGSIPFNGTPEQEKQLNEIMKAHSDDKGALMPVLQKAQEIYGYLPIEVQTMIARGLNIPLEEV